MSFSLGGLASGFDTGMLIEQLMRIERQPVVRLEAQKKIFPTNRVFSVP